ncbi:RHS repeat-associated core domain-containing protein [Chengkuizengella axinellae]|uniref:RHS repeat-associated core domain-containing protein n=1 Tax=Chengkuizengella axinellae TaxID=3064388 RepID=A0ABT9J3I5_9BACL|nr:RHS repeat-associated core domain-containing protein [Chengkuizengella sp. 2205SS18-9]MDP5276155.1 RHS repeat-associated core domain-containing protein [Chengkuizengella sp. 2205SS18-9]
MKKKVLKPIIITLIFTLLVTGFNLQGVYPSVYAENDKAKTIEEKKPLKSAKEDKKNLEKRFGVTQEFIQSELNKGYTLKDIEEALKYQEKNNKTYAYSIKKVKPKFINPSKSAQSIIRNELQEVDENKKDKEDKDDKKDKNIEVSILAGDVPDEETLNNVNLQTNEAPYSITLKNETVSTLSGGLSIQETDFVLPGRNGLSFALSRTYNSASSQYYKLSSSTGESTYEDEHFPIGKGWSWDIPYIEIIDEKMYLNLAGGGSYKITGSSEYEITGYLFDDLTFESDSSVTVNRVTSQYVLKSISGIKQFFDSKGRLIQIQDAYSNTIDFTYTDSLLSTVTDAIGNTITITSTSSQVVIQYGEKTVTYKKVQEGSVTLLSQVIDPMGRVTTYDYDLKAAEYSLTSTTPSKSNPYALLSGVTHPTGSKSIYTYGSRVKRYLSHRSVNEAYKVNSREEIIFYEDGSQESKNMQSFTYDGDLSSSYNQDITFSTTLSTGPKSTIFYYKKVYKLVNRADYYNTEVVTEAGDLKEITTYTYDEKRRLSFLPIETSSQTMNIVDNATSEMITTSTQYDDYGNVISSTNPLGITTTYTYDETSKLLKNIHQPINDSTTLYTVLERNTQSSITQMQVYENDEKGKLLQQVNYENYDEYGNVTQTRIKNDDKDIVSQMLYSEEYQFAYPRMKWMDVSDVDGTVSTLSTEAFYDVTTGQTTQYTDGNGNVSSYEYDELGRVVRAIHPDGSDVQMNFDDLDNIIVKTDEEGIQWVTKFNPIGLVTELGRIEHGVYKSKEKYGYDEFGNQIWIEDALGNRTEFIYGEWNRNIETIYADGYRSTTHYEVIQHTVTSTDPEQNSFRTTFDMLGRIIKEEEITNGVKVLATYEHDQLGNIIESFDAKGYKTTYEYDSLNRLTGVINAKLETTQYDYDMVGNLTTIVYADTNQLQKQYDELGRLIKRIDPEQKEDKFYYDANGNVTERMDRNGDIFTFEYSDRNFLMKKISGDETIGFTYNSSGKRLSMTDATGTTLYDYDEGNGQLNQMTYPDGKNIQYYYNESGNRIQMTDPFRLNLYYDYDENNQLSSVGKTMQDAEATYSYYTNGLLQKIEQGNGVESIYTYEGLNLDTLTHQKQDGTIVNQYQYGYDNNGNITSKLENDVSNQYDYDELNRMTTSDEFDESYTYDARGNREEFSNTFISNERDVDYTYDDRDRLIQVIVDGSTVQYKYNGDNLLYERIENGETTRYYYDGKVVIAEATVTDSEVKLKARYIRGRSLVSTEDAYANQYYYLKNGHGDVVELRDSTGDTRLNQYEYDVWGNPVKSIEMIHNPFQYSGEFWDNVTDLQYLRARWYDPSDGRFITEDIYEGEINNPLSLNLYTYVLNNPLIYIDPTGKYCVSVDGNWAHGGECNSEDSIPMGDDSLHTGAEIIENGVIVGYIGIYGPFLPEEGNFWDIHPIYTTQEYYHQGNDRMTIRNTYFKDKYDARVLVDNLSKSTMNSLLQDLSLFGAGYVIEKYTWLKDIGIKSATGLASFTMIAQDYGTDFYVDKLKEEIHEMEDGPVKIIETWYNAPGVNTNFIHVEDPREK